MNTELIRLFNAALVAGNDEEKIDAHQLNTIATRKGYIIDPRCATREVADYIEDISLNPNSTFYKTWSDITEKDCFELFLDQCMHYATTYGVNYNLGIAWTPNDQDYSEVPDYKKYTIIRAVTPLEMYDLCYELVCSGIALKQETMEAVCDFIVEIVAATRFRDKLFDIDTVKNREASIYLCDRLDIRPRDKFSLLRYIIYKTTGSTLIIKSADMLEQIRRSDHQFDFNELDEEDLVNLSTIFYRFKDIFLAFRLNVTIDCRRKGWRAYVLRMVEGSDNRSVINRIRRLATKNHVPFEEGVLESMLSIKDPTMADFNRITAALDKANNFKLVCLLQGINERINMIKDGSGFKSFVIRNGKIYTKQCTQDPERREYFNVLKDMVETKLVDNIRTKRETDPRYANGLVRFNRHIIMACPSSEKNFVENIPFGSKFRFDKENIIGIYWKNEWGTRDFDLSFIDISGNKIGWNSYYTTSDKKVIYSGDMTNADPGASELLYMEKGCPDGLIYVNRYNGNPGSRYKLFFAQQHIADMHRNYMVNPTSICFEQLCYSKDMMEQMVGLVKDNTIYFVSFDTFNRAVSDSNGKVSPADIMDGLSIRARSGVDLKSILIKAGFEDYELKRTIFDIYQKELGTDEKFPDPCIDLEDLNRSTLIDLFK